MSEEQKLHYQIDALNIQSVRSDLYISVIAHVARLESCMPPNPISLLNIRYRKGFISQVWLWNNVA
jgi:hypothetical protein